MELTSHSEGLESLLGEDYSVHNPPYVKGTVSFADIRNAAELSEKVDREIAVVPFASREKYWTSPWSFYTYYVLGSKNSIDYNLPPAKFRDLQFLTIMLHSHSTSSPCPSKYWVFPSCQYGDQGAHHRRISEGGTLNIFSKFGMTFLSAVLPIERTAIRSKKFLWRTKTEEYTPDPY